MALRGDLGKILFSIRAVSRPNLRRGGGPAVLGIPEDVFAEPASVEKISVERTAASPRTGGDLKRLHAFLAHAKRPLVIVASPRWSGAAADALTRFAELYDLPVATAFRRQDRFDNRKRSYVGHLGLATDAQLQAGVRAAFLDAVVAAIQRPGSNPSAKRGVIR